MNQQLVFTIIAHDKVGIVTKVADIVSQYEGNWLDSRMSQLAGEFAGIVHVEVPLEKRKSLEEALLALTQIGISITLHQTHEVTQDDEKYIELQIIGNDRKGLVAELAKLFSENGINIVELDTDTSEAPVTGGFLFHASAVISVRGEGYMDDLQEKLHALSDALGLDIEWTARL